MKKHAIIPVFIPHRGCPNDCVFCNQKAITARTADVTPEDVRNTIEQYLPTLMGRDLDEIELAFFGGSFTGIPIEEQSAFLEVAKEYKDKGLITKIHMSTRPDYINEEILDNLKKYDADTIELGVQSFDEEVLKASNRGHDAEVVYKACELIKQYGFTLGIQLMIGLPCDTPEKSIESARKAATIKPQIARLYPTVIIKDTALFDMYKAGVYKPIDHETMVDTVAEMYKILTGSGVNVIRVGLKSTDLINDGDDSEVAGNSYHPAFKQLALGKIAREIIEERIREMFPQAVSLGYWSGEQSTEDSENAENVFSPCPTICIKANDKNFDSIIGHKGINKKYFENEYPWLNFRYEKEQTLADNDVIVVKL